jgi:DNA-binding NtrC family response regulator
MSKPLRILIVEDSEDDTLLLLWALRRGGYEPSYERVENAEALKAALARQAWDIVVSDYNMPQLNALAALVLLQEGGFDLPFFIVSGSISEDATVAARQAGACAYLTKDDLAQFVQLIDAIPLK